MPTFLIDEDMPRSLAPILAQHGFEVKDVRDCGLRGATDEAIFLFAQREQATIITADRGFGNILRFPLGKHFGIVVVDIPHGTSSPWLNEQVLQALRFLSEQDVVGNVVIVEPRRLRIRRK